MSARAVLDRALAGGFNLERRGDKLHVEPTPSPELVADIRAHKAELLGLLARPLLPAGEPTKGDCFLCSQPVHWRGPLEGLVNAFGDAIHLRCPS